MTLVTGGRSRERVLLFGMEGTGKSDAILDVATRVYPNRVHIVDNDNAWDRMLEGVSVSGNTGRVLAEYRWDAASKSFEHDAEWCVDDGNIVVYHVDGWEANAAAIAEIRTDADRSDWCGIDSGSSFWDDVQDWYIDTVFDKTKADFFMQARMAMARGDSTEALDGWKDWSVINAEYKEKVMGFLITPPCHLLVTCEQAEVSSVQIKGKQIEDAETRNLYGARKVKPRGQKRIGHNVQTVLQLVRQADGTYHVHTVKDRGGRERYTGEDVTGQGFATWYLEEVANWTEQEDMPVPSTPKKIVPKGMVAKG